MTKLDVNLSGKKQETTESNETDSRKEMTEETETLHANEEPATIPIDTPTIMIGEIEITTESIKKPANEPLVTFEWRIIKRIAVSQMILSLVIS